MLSWQECLEQGIITHRMPDLERSRKLILMADLRLEFWNKTIKEKFLSLKVEAYYEVIKDLIFARLHREGYNCSNHLCLISYLKQTMNDFDFEIHKIDELRKIRNEISYRGFTIKKDYFDRNESHLKAIISHIRINP